MKKIETIWHHLLFAALESRQFEHTQQDLAAQFGFSTSTIHHALEVPTSIGAIQKFGKHFSLTNFQKLLYYWASMRKLEDDIALSFYIDKPVRELESLVPPEAIYAGYSAYRLRFTEPAGDYNKVHFYLPAFKKADLLARFDADAKDIKSDNPNIIILKKPVFMENYGKITTIPQTFVDIWNLPDWYSVEFINGLKEKMQTLLL